MSSVTLPQLLELHLINVFEKYMEQQPFDEDHFPKFETLYVDDLRFGYGSQTQLDFKIKLPLLRNLELQDRM